MSDYLSDNVKENASVIGALGFTGSLFNNPLIKRYDFFEGMFAHALVGAGSSIGAVIGGCILARIFEGIAQNRSSPVFAGKVVEGSGVLVW